LPAEPKIFHGRHSELQDVVKALGQESARISILGAGGIGKTSLARAALHHPEIISRYDHRLFIGCESAATSVELASIIASHVGLNPKKDLAGSVVHYFSTSPPCLLILDNLETPWEPLESRGSLEEFLSLLTEVSHLALIITMRGAERPAKIRWTHPFLPPLKPLAYEAARQTFFDIADDFHNSNNVDELLLLTDNVPLAVNLVAHLVDYEGCESVLARWKTEKTSMLSQGYDRRSSLAISITVSLSSPRMTSSPAAKELLSLLSILPDGLSDVELLQSDLPIRNILKCKAALLRTSLAYNDDRNQLKTLAPIREYIKHINPPSPLIIQPLRTYFHELIGFAKTYHGQISGVQAAGRIILNLANVQNVL
ncbi:P-loop containing nucleoside triphosphate hydrolase protein, partial [Mycena latifolia]